MTPTSVLLAAIAPNVAASGGVSVPTGNLAETTAIGRGLGAGGTAHLDAGVTVARLITPHAFAERTWFGCGSESCGASSWLFGAGVRVESRNTGLLRVFGDLGAGYRSLDTVWVTPGDASVGSSSTITWWQRVPKPHVTMSGIEARLSMGIAHDLSRMFALELAAHAAFGQFSRVSPTPPVTREPAMHAFYGLSLGVRFRVSEGS